MRLFDKYRMDVHSQTGEDGLIDEIMRRIKPTEKTFCEFGAADGKYCSNSFYLLEQGWTGKYIEASPGHAKDLIDNTMGKPVELHFGPVTVANVNQLVPQRLTLLSIDVDNDDFHIWQAYTGTADVVVIEVNSSIAPPQVVVPGERGSSYSAMVMLGLVKGYFLVAHKGNCIFVLNKYRALFPEAIGDGFANTEDYFDKSWL